MSYQQRKIGYIVVSRYGDIADHPMLQSIDFDSVFVDKLSEHNTKRPELELLLNEFLREKDHVFVHELNVLARSMIDLQKIIHRILVSGAQISSLSENLTFDTKQNNHSQSKNLFELLTIFADFELSVVRQKQREGIDKAKLAGKHLGRPRKISDNQRVEILKMTKQGDTPTKIAKIFNISRGSVYKIVADVEQQKNARDEKAPGFFSETARVQQNPAQNTQSVNAVTKGIARQLSHEMSEKNEKKYSLVFEELFGAIIQQKYSDYQMIREQVEQFTGYTRYKSGFLMNKIIAKLQEAGLVTISEGEKDTLHWK